MSYTLAMKKPFLADIDRLDPEIQKRAWSAVSEIEQYPVTPRGDTVKKLKHHDRLWRYRLGDYRLVYATYTDNNIVQLIAIGRRGEIYDRINYRPEEPNYSQFSALLEQTLDPNKETPPDWAQYAQAAQPKRESRALPYLLTPRLLNAWHIPTEFHAALTQCKTEDQLLESGVSQETLLHLLDCLFPADVNTLAQSPNLLLGSAKDLERYVSGDLLTFLLFLDDDQKRLVDFGLSGPTLIKGGPGSGKSTVALYRVRAIADKQAKSQQPVKILFTTYTNALVNASEQMLSRLMENCPQNVTWDISTLDKLAMDVVSIMPPYSKPRMARTGDLKYAITSARTAFRSEGKNPLEDALVQKAVADLRDDYLQEEFEWVIEGRGLRNIDAYLATDRSGRGIAFDARLRRAVWQLYEHYKQFLKNLKVTTWGDLRFQAWEQARSSTIPMVKWDYVLIDEAQDLTPIALSFAMELCKTPAGMFLTADACQSLYNKGFAWKDVNENLRVQGRTRLLKRNYRTTRQIVTAAADLLRKAGAGDEEALTQFFVHAGPPPCVYAANSEADQFIWLASEIQNACRELRLPISSAAVLAPTNDLARQAAQRLTTLGVATDYVNGKDLNLQTPHAKALTIYSAKGLEFPIIAIPYVEEGTLPRLLEDERADDLEKHLQQELRVLFVGCTRAMRRLLIAYRVQQASRFVENLDPQLWETETFA